MSGSRVEAFVQMFALSCDWSRLSIHNTKLMKFLWPCRNCLWQVLHLCLPTNSGRVSSLECRHVPSATRVPGKQQSCGLLLQYHEMSCYIKQTYTCILLISAKAANMCTCHASISRWAARQARDGSPVCDVAGIQIQVQKVGQFLQAVYTGVCGVCVRQI